MVGLALVVKEEGYGKKRDEKRRGQCQYGGRDKEVIQGGGISIGLPRPRMSQSPAS